MLLMFIILGLGLVCEALLYVNHRLWSLRRTRITLSGVAILLTSFAATGLLILDFSYVMALLALSSGVRVINQLRIVKARLHRRYLYTATRNTSITMTIIQLLLVLVWLGMHTWSITATWWLAALVGLQLVVALVALLSTMRTLRRTRLAPLPVDISSEALPTVTVAIPARNETDDLEACLYSVVRSDYPKLEILVLDDCSQLKRTPAIIRDFAHAGVRFVRGEVPDANWLAKNLAYDKLAREANGEIVLFCGVDVRFEPSTIRQLVYTLIKNKKSMMSVLPLRYEAHKPQLSITQAIRYAWEIVPPRKLFRRPPVLSTCWLIYRRTLQDLGGFTAVKRAITPEAYFAKQLISLNDSYSFKRSDKAHGLWSAKRISAQRLTAIRTRYPSLHRRPEIVFLLSVFELTVLVGTFIIAPLAYIELAPAWASAVAALSALLFICTYALISVVTKTNSWYMAPFLTLFAVLGDIVLMYRSMWLYEFSEVLWKGRNVCIPVMHTEPQSLERTPTATSA